MDYRQEEACENRQLWHRSSDKIKCEERALDLGTATLELIFAKALQGSSRAEPSAVNQKHEGKPPERKHRTPTSEMGPGRSSEPAVCFTRTTVVQEG